MGRSKVGNAERKRWNEGICQLNVLSGLEGSKEKEMPAKQWFWLAPHVRSQCQFLASVDKPLVLANPQRRWMMTKPVVSVTVMGGVDGKARQH